MTLFLVPFSQPATFHFQRVFGPAFSMVNYGELVVVSHYIHIQFKSDEIPRFLMLNFPSKSQRSFNPMKSNHQNLPNKSSSGHWNLQLGLQGQAQGWHTTWAKTCQVRGATWRVLPFAGWCCSWSQMLHVQHIYRDLPYKSPECRYKFHTWSIWAFAKLVPMSPRINVSFFCEIWRYIYS